MINKVLIEKAAAVKIVFFDVDETLRPLNGHVLESTREAFSQLKSKRIAICIASGRGYASLDSEIRSLNADYFITVTGQYIQSAAGRELYSHPMPIDVIEKVVAWAKKEKIELLFVGARESALTKWDALSRECFTHGYEEVDEDPEFYLKQAVYQILTVCPPSQAVILPAELDKFSYLHRWNKNSYDIILRHGDKGTGIHKLLEKLQVPSEQACAFGDGLNDIAMFESVGIGVAMGNAADELKKVASMVTSSVYDDGIKSALEALKMIN